MIIDEDGYLEHHGVMGMKWGRRKEVTPEEQLNREKKAQKYVKRSNNIQREIDKLDLRTPRSKTAARDIAFTRRVLVTQQARANKDAERKRAGKLSTEQRKQLIIASGIVGLFVASRLSGGTKVGDIPNAPRAPGHGASVKDIINAERDTQMYSLTRMHKEGKMDASQYKAFSEKLNLRYDKKIVDALGGLK